MGEVEGRPASAAATGWRYWQLLPGPPVRLHSLSQRGIEWPPGRPLVARCVGGRTAHSGGHAAPGADCGCGIHASVDLASLHSQALCLRPVPLVVGQVRLWGRVVTEERPDRLGEDHRGALAYPSRLWVVGETLPEGVPAPALASAVSATYAVPVGTMSLDEAAGAASRTILGFLAMSRSTAGEPPAVAARQAPPSSAFG